MELDDHADLNPPRIEPSFREPTSTDKKSSEKKNEESEVISKLAEKLLTGQSLKSTEREYLTKLSEQKVDLNEQILSMFKCREINDLSDKILKSKLPFEKTKTNFEKITKAQKTLTISEQKALSKLLLCYDQTLNNSYFITQASKVLESGKTLSRIEIKKLIDKHNEISPPTPKKAGFLALQVGECKVYYNKMGYLTLAPLDRKMTTPILVQKKHMNLDKSKIDEIKNMYRKVVSNKPYNNLAPMLELMGFFHEMKEQNPEITLKEAYQAFNPSVSEIYDKYQSGDCVILAGKFQDSVKGLGLELGVVGQYTGPQWAQPPVPNPSGNFQEWRAYDKQTENVHHCAAAFRYQDQNKQEKVMYFDTFTQLAMANGEDIQEGENWENMKEKYIGGSSRDTSENITNVDHILKMQIAGKTKMLLSGDGKMTQLLGLDLLRGNLYLNSEGAKDLKGLPLASNGRFSISLQNLRNPQEKGIYFINGLSEQITHQEALRRFFLLAKDRFHLPDDFEEKLMILAQNEDEIINHILLSPTVTAKATLRESTAAYEMIREINTKSENFRLRIQKETDLPSEIKNLMRTYVDKQKQIEKQFNQLQQAIIDDKPEIVRNHAKKISEDCQLLKNLEQSIIQEPVNLY